VQILNRVGLTKLGGLISVVILILGLVISVSLIAFEQLVGAVSILFSTMLGVFLTLMFSRVSSHLGVAKKTLRRLEKTMRDTNAQLALLTGDTSATYLSASTEESDLIGRKEFDEIKQMLQERSSLENQVLREIAAESRLIRMVIAQEDDSTGK